MNVDIGEQFFTAMFDKRSADAALLLASTVQFQALTPGGLEAADSPAATVDALAELLTPEGTPTDFRTQPFHGRGRVSYTIAVTADAGERIVYEQIAYFDVVDGRISTIQLLCSGDLRAAP